jgi:non-ribosomal peptide synthetase-like protein
MCLLPIGVKWLLVGRWKVERFPIWSLRYVRFWMVKALLRASPLRLFTGSPLAALHLRALGARIGPGALVLTTHIPVCTDLLTIGAGAVVRKDSFLNAYRIVDGYVETGPVRVGEGAVVGEMTVLDVHTVLGDRAELAHASSLHPGQSVPAGERWLGSPAEPSGRTPERLPPARCGRPRRIVYALLQLSGSFLLWTPLLIGAANLLLPEYEELGQQELLDPATYGRHALAASALFWAAITAGLVLAVLLPRACARVLPPGRVFRLYGVRWSVQRVIARFTNLRLYTFLFGDSSAIVHWLRAMGWDLSRVEQTGSNFGMAVKHEVPGLSAVGTGTMVSDGLSMANAEFSATSFCVRSAAIGARNYVGNNVLYPAGGRTGENVLLATKVHVPVDGPVRKDVGLLGSPPFEIPRSVERDLADRWWEDPSARRRALQAKNRHNLVSALLFLAVRWFNFVIVTLIYVLTVDNHSMLGPTIVSVGIVGSLLFTTTWFVLVDRFFPRRQPMFCSIYDEAFWRHERYWKVPAMTYVEVFNGTPYKSLVYRALGARVGRRVLDDGSWFTERSLVTIGDDCVLNEGALIQGHSLEDGVFKSDHIVMGSGCTVGTAAFVHYGVRMEDGTHLAADSFLMKGETVRAGEHWGGNPARPLIGQTFPADATTAAAVR